MLKAFNAWGLLAAAVFSAAPVIAQPNMNNNAAFVGTWCAQGDPGKRASISANGPFNLTLTNEQGSTSNGMVTGINSRQVTATGWNLVQGTLSPDGSTISWSNNTFWQRCSGGGHRHAHLQGTWYAQGDPSKPCHIDQRKGTLTLRNEIGQTASGSFSGPNRFSAVWSGTTIYATVSKNQNRIDWSNNTFWSR